MTGNDRLTRCNVYIFINNKQNIVWTQIWVTFFVLVQELFLFKKIKSNILLKRKFIFKEFKLRLQ